MKIKVVYIGNDSVVVQRKPKVSLDYNYCLFCKAATNNFFICEDCQDNNGRDGADD